MHIPVNKMKDISGDGIAITREIITDDWLYNELKDSHRDDYHLFLIQEEGTSEIRVDFQSYHLEPRSIMCLHPNQVHQLGPFSPGKASFLIMNNENLLPAHLNLLEELTPLKPIQLTEELFQLIADTVGVCIRIYENGELKMHLSLIKESCNILVGLLLSAYLTVISPYDKLSRSEMITKSFKTMLENKFITFKRPADYAQELNISTTYLYECVRKTTGLSVSQHIEQRIILEAKRLLYYSDRSVKQIASDLGFNDYPYFTRLFAKVTGMTALAFRRKNL